MVGGSSPSSPAISYGKHQVESVCSVSTGNSIMTVQKAHHLSQAQAYYLHVLGVDLYGLTDAEQSVDESSQDVQPTPPPNETHSQPVSSLEAVKLKLQNSSQLKPEPEQEPQPVLTVLISEQAFKQSIMVSDLCVLHGVAIEQVQKLADDCFQLGPIQWRFVKRVDSTSNIRFKFTDNKLISEPLNKLTNVDVKRALWSALGQSL